MDLFEREQQIYDSAAERLNEIQAEAQCSANEFGCIVNEYGRLLRQLRRVTKISDKTTVDLRASNLVLLDKVNCDPLTGIYNRRYMDENLKRIIGSVSCCGGMLSVFMIDVDLFKQFNDTYGHSKGDNCLKTVAAAINDSITRIEDFVVRYGGEEFVVVLPNTDVKGAKTIAKRMIENVKACNIPHEKNEAASCVTISIGITTSAVNLKHSGADYINRADEALYISKRSGRNRYTFAEFFEEVN